MAKSHYVASSTPVKCDEFITTLCGLTLDNPVLIPAWDDVPTGVRLNTNALTGCRKCVEKLAELAGVTYLVSVRSATVQQREQEES